MNNKNLRLNPRLVWLAVAAIAVPALWVGVGEFTGVVAVWVAALGFARLGAKAGSGDEAKNQGQVLEQQLLEEQQYAKRLRDDDTLLSPSFSWMKGNIFHHE